MANNETLDKSALSEQAEVHGGHPEGVAEGLLMKSEGETVPGPRSDGQSGSASPVSVSPGPELAASRPPSSGPPSVTSNTSILSMPHPKKFSHVNINKKFLEKNSSGSTSSQTLSSSITKPGSSTQKPVLPTTATHSRLVTTKLTAAPHSSTAGPGWSRPPSTPSSAAQTPSIGTGPRLGVHTPITGHPVSLPSPAGKVIQPQPRAIVPEPPVKEGSNKPAWGTAQVTATVAGKSNQVQNDFPTAAEVAQGRAVKLAENKQAAQAAAVQKQVQSAEADAFRGVHLDPKAHHWDEEEDDDDNFLDGVIEFGDGRQYNIQTANDAAQSLLSHAANGELDPTKRAEPVRKEDRFADDFDRSWPPRNVPAQSHQPREAHPNRPASSASSQSLQSPQEASRALFNERSNRLEPYSNSQQPGRFVPPGQSPQFIRRGSRSDHPASPTESRNGRDYPPHAPPHNVQLLQKPNGDHVIDGPSRPRASGDRGGLSPTSPFESNRYRDREPPRRDHSFTSHQDSRPIGQSHEYGRGRDNHNSHGFPSPHANEPDRGQRPSMGPPPSPHHPLGSRQLPPHLSNMRSPSQPTRGLASDHPPPSSTTLTLNTTSVSGPSSVALTPQSPAVSLVALSPSVTESPSQSSAMPIVDIDEVRKAAMHSAAERARLRRQQEEEEREKERERARKKAAELEEKILALEAEKTRSQASNDTKVTEAQVIDVIEEAVQSAKSARTANDGREQASSSVSPFSSSRPLARPPSLRGGPRLPPSAGRSSFPDAVSPAVEAESWRSKSTLPRAQPPHHIQPPASIPPPPPPPPIPEAVTLTVEADEDLEVVDFAELGKFVGDKTKITGTETRHSHPVDDLPARPSRSVAADFFDDPQVTSSTTATGLSEEEGSWRRKAPIIHEHPSSPKDEQPESLDAVSSKEKLRLHITPDSHRPTTQHVPLHTVASSQFKPPRDEHNRSHTSHSQTLAGPSNHGPLRSPLTPSYREAPMSALYDVMSRVKVVLDGMKPEHQPPSRPQKWLPPALRLKSEISEHPRDSGHVYDEHHEHLAPREVFDVTGYAPPRSPGPVWKVFSVKLPRTSHRVEAMRRSSMLRTQPQVRSDIFSWNPAPEGYNRRDFSFNDILFRKPAFYKGRVRYTVSLPRTSSVVSSSTNTSSGPIVHLPSKPATSQPNTVSGFGRTKEAAELTSWRKPTTRAMSPLKEFAESSELDTVSRSPPPETPASGTATALPKSERPSSPFGNGVPAKAKLHQPKMPAGSDVAFYRDSHVVAPQPKPTVSFIVSSELDDEQKASSEKPALVIAPSAFLGSSPSDSSHVISAEQNMTDKSPDVRVAPTRTVVTPPPSSPWSKSPKAFSVKDSPARGPDPEHLKAVWLQTPEKMQMTSVNSLEAIADDMPAVPFTLQDVKSEGGTPPPLTATHPKMSLHDVTRAFQQVPTSSSSSSSRSAPAPAPSTSSTSSSMPRQPNFAFPPHPGTNMRPPYSLYGSPLLSHSPSPTVMYPHPMTPSPIPRPMVINGTSSPYAAPMWLPMPGTAPQAGMMRPSPYPAQLMAYPPPGTAMPMYGAPPPSGIPGPPPHQLNGVQTRVGGMPIMSPVQQPAHVSHAIYAQSPVLMHSPQVMAMPPGQSYHGPVQPGRGQVRGSYDLASSHPQHSAPFTSVPSNTFARPSW